MFRTEFSHYQRKVKPFFSPNGIFIIKCVNEWIHRADRQHFIRGQVQTCTVSSSFSSMAPSIYSLCNINSVSFSFHSRWVISLSVDTGNQGNPARLIVADIIWQNPCTPVETQRQGEKRRASDYKAVTTNQQGISKWEITFSLTKSFFATEKQSGVSSSSINTVCISFSKTKNQFWQPGIKKVLPVDLTVHYKCHDLT